VHVELLHNQELGPELRKAVCHARSLETMWTYLEDHLREQREGLTISYQAPSRQSIL
jgi:hypothetical protein